MTLDIFRIERSGHYYNNRKEFCDSFICFSLFTLVYEKDIRTLKNWYVELFSIETSNWWGSLFRIGKIDGIREWDFLFLQEPFYRFLRRMFIKKQRKQQIEK